MTTRSIARLYDAALSASGLRQVAYTILSRLDGEGPLLISELAGRLSLERTTCSREVSSLVAAGLVDVEVGRDRRQRLIRLSNSGADALAGARPRWHEVQSSVEDAFGNGRTDELLDGLRALLQTSERLATR